MVKKNKKNAKRLNQNRDRFSLFLYTAKFTKAGLVEGRAEDTKYQKNEIDYIKNHRMVILW